MFVLKEELLAILAAGKEDCYRVCCAKLTPGWVKLNTKSAAEFMSKLLSLQDSAAYDVVRALVEYGVQPNFPLNQCCYAADNIFLGDLYSEKEDLLGFLVRHGANFDYIDADDNEIFKFYKKNKDTWLASKCSVQAMPQAGPSVFELFAVFKFRPSYAGLKQRHVSTCRP